MSELDALGTRYVRSDKTGIDYALLVRLAQDHTTRYPLVDGRGNFGSVDGDPPADACYTDVRLSPLGREREHFPNELVNGFPPHNLREVADAVVAALDGADPLAHLPGPDFPTGGVLVDPAEIRAVYAGRPGTLRLRARVAIEERELVITELPFGVTKGGDGGVIRDIADRVVDGSLPGVSDIQDHSDRSGMRLRIFADDLRATLERLYALTSLEIAIPVDFDPRALIDRFLEGRDPETVCRELPELARRHGDPRRTTLP